MSYQVLARKWRPQRFEDVIGQRGVTQTLRNAIAANRIAQSFVFSGPRGVGKTTTARILARGLNCDTGPTAEPCGTCDPCIEIAQGRDMDVIEIDAATNTQIDKVREVIIAGLGVRPARDRYKIFIIDEVHRLSPQSFDALLKSVEEPPPHVVFMMATTEIEKVPVTIQSRSQVFELKSIGLNQIADHLRLIAEAEKIAIDEAAILLLARAGDGSMRDAQSSLDQVMAFAGDRITAEDVATVLGLVRRDVLMDIAEAVAAENAAAAFAFAGQAVEAGYDLRLVVRELARLTRDLLVVRIDPSRASDTEIAAEGERDRLLALAKTFSNEDLMRAFEILTKADYEIRTSAYPRYHLEMALLRWIHLRQLVPISDLIQGLEKGGVVPPRSGGSSGSVQRPAAPRRAAPAAPEPGPRAVRRPAPFASSTAATVKAVEAATKAAPNGEGGPDVQPVAAADVKDAFLDEVRKQKKFLYGTVVAQAQRIDVERERIVFTFTPQHRALRAQLDQPPMRAWLETIATKLAGHRMAVVAEETSDGAAVPRPGAPSPATGPVESTTGAAPSGGDTRQAELRQQALADSGVQAMLDVFAADIKDVEELKRST
ncbi:MAG: DNA polymerase III subunit gamma/tau [Acidobacteria bacterium]|nr:DNA polymerase III subunit gamma/tau [Acidobacteriota bacterium]MBA3887350.1 DNA polymerase III subunit gamma/tau [Acidobacteriota bacterium]